MTTGAPETTDDQLRAVGFTSAARQYPRDEIAMRLLCAFNGVKPGQAPPGWWFYPNNASHEAWKRVADEAKVIFQEQKP